MNDDVEIVRVITEPTRYAIMCLLLKHNYCVRALARKLGISEPAVSQHMNVFKRYGIVTGHKLGYQVHYRIDRERITAALASVTGTLSTCDSDEKLSRFCTCEFSEECSRKKPDGENK